MKNLLFIFLLFVTVSGQAQNLQPEWIQAYGGASQGNFWPYVIQADDAGNVYVLSGHGGPVSSYSYELVITKYSSSGNVLWRDTLADTNSDPQVLIYPDHSLVVATTAYDTIPNGEGTWITHYTPGGVVQWSLFYNASQGIWNETLSAMKADSSGNLYVTVRLDTLLSRQLVTFKCDSTGNLLWMQRYKQNGYLLQPNDLAIDAQGNSYIALTRSDSVTSAADGLLLKYNASGQLLAQTIYNTGQNENFNYIALVHDTTVYIGGTTSPLLNTFDWLYAVFDSSAALVQQTVIDPEAYFGFPGSDSINFLQAMAVDTFGAVYLGGSFLDFTPSNVIAIVKILPGGTVDFVSTPLPNCSVTALAFNPAGELFAAGIDKQIPNAYAMLLLKLDASGNMLWWTNYGLLDNSKTLLDIDNAGTIFTNYADRSGSLRQIVTMKYDYTTAIVSQEQNTDVLLFPNPATETIIISDAAQRRFDFRLYNTTGQLVHSEQQVQPGTPVSLVGVAAGIYFYVLRVEDSDVLKGKLLKE
jgi:hypothetical protein